MDWSTLYPATTQPTPAQIAAYIATPLWRDLNDHLAAQYETQPTVSHSICSGQPGWNVKYQKAGRSLCTLYPMPGHFIALVVIGAKEQTEAELMLPTCDETIQNLYHSAATVMGGRWLMIPVTSEKILTDVKRLIQTRRKPKPRA